MKDYKQRNFDKLCAALTMDELANFMDCLPIPSPYHMIGDTYTLPSVTLSWCMIWDESPQGFDYWYYIASRLENNEYNEAKKVR